MKAPRRTQARQARLAVIVAIFGGQQATALQQYSAHGAVIKAPANLSAEHFGQNEILHTDTLPFWGWHAVAIFVLVLCVALYGLAILAHHAPKACAL